MTIRELESLYESLTPDRGTEFINSIRAVDGNPQVSTLQLLGKLELFAADFRPEGKRICAEGASMSQSDRDMITLHGRIVAALLLLLQKTKSVSRLRDYALLFLEYAAAVVRTKYDYMSTALDVICYRITDIGIRWDTIENASSLDLLSYKLVKDIRFDRTQGDTLSFRGRGSVFCRDGMLSVSSSEAVESGAKAFSVCGGRVGVYTRNVRDEKLKGTAQSDAGALRQFAETFLRVQEEGARRVASRPEYRNGETVDILVQDVVGDSLVCRVLGAGAGVRGRILEEELIKGLRTGDLIDYFREQDVIRGAVLYVEEGGYSFSIAEAYTAFARAQAEREWRSGAFFRARVYRVDEEWGRVNWMTPSGYAGISRLEDTPGVKVGDTAVLQVLNIQKQGANTYINLCYPKFDVGAVLPFAEEDVLIGFITTEEKVLSEASRKTEESAGKEQETLRILSSILSSTSAIGSSTDTYRHLLAALFLAVAGDDGGQVSRLRAAAYFLGQCLSFAQGDGVVSVRDAGLQEGEGSIIRLLAAWDAPGDDIREELLRWDGGSLPGKVAALVFSARVSEMFREELKTDREQVRRSICALLGVEDSFVADGSQRRGKYGCVEGQEVEFKSSYVFRNDGGGADIDAQGRGEVFEAVCGFLNADGGVLYLGVNDQGDPILARDRGLAADKDWLAGHRLQVNRDRYEKLGHSTLGEKIGEEGNLDAFVQFLNGEKELYFKDAFWGNITITVTEDNDAIRIAVEPARFELAYLYPDKTGEGGVAYVRDGGRTVYMSQVQKAQRLAGLKRISKEMGFVVTIQEAIDRHRRLVFKDYASGTRGEVKDRYVVPVNLLYNDENVYCYDLESRRYKQFRLHRIGAVEYSEDVSPYPLPVMAAKEADVFRWIPNEEGRSYHVRLRMDVAAKNYLLEEYSCAEKLPREEFYEEKKDKWILDTRVNGLGAVRRFYLGLADRIEILESEDSEELKKEISEFLKKYV